MPSSFARAPLRFRPSGWQLAALDGLIGAACVSAAMLLRFVDEPSVPATYAQRLLPWALLAALIQIGVGWLMNRLRRPGSVLALRPVAPFALGTLVGLLVVLAINDLALREPWRLPHFVAVMGPLLAGAASAALRLARTRSVDLEALLARPIVRLDLEACAPVVRGKRLAITGAAGSIGAELAKQALALEPAALLAIDTNETGLFELENALRSPLVQTAIGDVADRRRLQELFARERPQVVFHAAAYKHVPLVEANPGQGFRTNVLGTLAVCEAALAAGVERVVVISTDKAVTPVSFMGLTKRVTELIVAAASQRGAGTTVFSAVRFGNVLGSRGSVVPTLLRQIEAGGPITITHPDAQRFFMTLSEAASLVLLSSTLSAPGAIYVLDMGDEVPIEQLAERLVRLHGLRLRHDVGVEYIGLRPGEKLREELHARDEALVPTGYPGVSRVQPTYQVDGPRLWAAVQALEARWRSVGLEPAEYPAQLRALIEAAVQPPASLDALAAPAS